MIGLYIPASYEGVLITPGGLVPVSGWATMNYERLTVANGALTIYPIPQYSVERNLRYGAGWALAGGSYADLTTTEAQIALLKAQAECLTLQLNAEGGGVLSYRIGDESFDKGGGITAMSGQRDGLLKAFSEACERYNGFVTAYGGLGW